jgi:ketosteroid isomerase-like protein
MRGIEALNRRDFEGALAPFHADVRFRDVGTGRSEQGIDALEYMLRGWLDSFADYHEIVEEALDLGEQVLVIVHSTARGRGSGLTVDERHGEIHEFRGDRVAQLTAYTTAEDALRAAGLLE